MEGHIFVESGRVSSRINFLALHIMTYVVSEPHLHGEDRNASLASLT